MTVYKTYKKKVKPKSQYHKKVDVHFMEITQECLLKLYPNCKLIKEPIIEWDNEEPIPVHLYPIVRQRSPAWFKIKSDYRGSDLPKLTGMFLHRACKLFKYPSYPGCIDEFVSCTKKEKIDLSSKQYILDWGTYHENNGMKALLDLFKVKGFEIQIDEVGTYHKDIGCLDFTSSPDGLFTAKGIGGVDQEIKGVIEIKCKNPYIKDKNGSGYFYNYIEAPDNMAHYQLMQPHLEMFATNREFALFVIFTLNGTKVFFIKRDDEYIELIIKIIHFVHKKYRLGKCFDSILKGGVKDPFNDIFETYSKFLSKSKQLLELYGSSKTVSWKIK